MKVRIRESAHERQYLKREQAGDEFRSCGIPAWHRPNENKMSAGHRERPWREGNTFWSRET
jgi:hypothetical protein